MELADILYHERVETTVFVHGTATQHAESFDTIPQSRLGDYSGHGAWLSSDPRSELAPPITLSATATKHGWQLVYAIEWNGQHRWRFAKCASIALHTGCMLH